MRILKVLVLSGFLVSSVTVFADEVVKKHEGPLGSRAPHPTESTSVDSAEGNPHQGPMGSKTPHPSRSTKGEFGKGKPHKGPAGHQLHHPTESSPAPVAPAN